nr:DNA-binding domain-containing protein [uncultured Sphingorhabdus sp.]
MQKWLETGDAEFAMQFGDAARAGLEVYLHNYRAQLMRCMDQTFPCTRAWVGIERFHTAVRYHIMAQPPTAWTLDAYPASFAAEVDTLFPDDAVTHKIALMELALNDAQTAADRSPLTRELLARLNWDNVALAHASGGNVLHHVSNAAEIWSALSRAEQPPTAHIGEVPISILVWRSNWDPRYRILDQDEAEIFVQMSAPLPFADICIQLEHKLGEHAALQRAGLLLARWADEAAVSIALMSAIACA